jgi:hypothetical protein
MLGAATPSSFARDFIMPPSQFEIEMKQSHAAYHHGGAAAVHQMKSLDPDSWMTLNRMQLTDLRVPQNRPAEINGVVDALNASLTMIKANCQAKIDAAKADLPKTGADAFKARMNALRDQAKADADRAIDDTYAKLNEIGNQHPESQPLIVQALQRAQGIVSDGINAIDSAINAVTDAGGWLAHQVEEGFDKAKHAIEDVANKVKDGLESIFSGW